MFSPIHETSVDGQLITTPTVLTANARIQLGDTVQLTFFKPHALSASAVLTVESSHKTEPAVDAIVLMSDSCIMGPQKQSHVVCRDWTSDLVLFRRGDQLHVRCGEPIEIDGEMGCEENVIEGNCRISGEDFALSLEQI